MGSQVSRREFLKTTTGALVTAGAMARTRPAAAAGELVIVGWGGAHEESLKKAVYDPFTAATGIKIKQVSATNQLALLKAQVQNNSPEWDIIKPQLTWWQSGAQFAQLLSDEEVQLGYGWGARVVVLAREGKPLAVELNNAILDQTFYAVSKISKNKEAAMKFITFASQAKPQAERPLLYPHGPTNRAAWGQLDARAKRDVVNYDLPGVLLRNPEWWMDNEAPLLEQWKKFLAA